MKNKTPPEHPKKSKLKTFFVDALMSFMTGLVKLIFRNKIVKKTPIDTTQRYLILCTHGSGLDIFHASAAIRPMKCVVVAAKKLYFGKFTGPLLRLHGAIPKKQFVADLPAMRLMKNAADAGNNLLLCPEGRSTPDGKNSYITPAAAKLIKWIGLPVLFVKPQGSYLTFPRWAKSLRFGKMTTEIGLLLTKSEVENLTGNDIYQRVVGAFTFNEYDYQLDNRIKFLTSSPAKNIYRMLFICPACKSRTDMASDSHSVFCKKCGFRANVGTNGRLEVIKGGYDVNETDVEAAKNSGKVKKTDLAVVKGGGAAFTRIDQWVAFEKAEIEKDILSPAFRYEIKTELLLEDDLKHGYEKLADGTFTIDRGGITYRTESFVTENADYRTKYAEIFYPANTLVSLSYDTHGLELYAFDGTQKYRFDHSVITYRIDLLIEAVYKNRTEN
ncbi:MAG: 1-acyl-sn-glycerol-3-phosphate acyltransferase [Clostridiales bacterium]|jgi:1-acyl-sn-glycerol-3-phosphate acyltransferase|nr:1-acyl-sn-glycerol-3-phosphate acyltransferase [Clostridiales bacterium]